MAPTPHYGKPELKRIDKIYEKAYYLLTGIIFMTDIYEKFAYDYDEFGEIDKYLGDEEAFFKKLFNEYNVNTVLDCACATGQHLLMFSKIGLCVSGSDYSKSMIDVANKNLKKYGKDVPIDQCDFRYLERIFSNRFDAVVCLKTALPHLHKDEDLITALISMRNRLNDNGLLVLTQGITHYNLKLPPIEVVINRSDFSRVFVKEFNDHFHKIHVIDMFHSMDRTENNQYDIVHKIILDDDYRELLLKAGYKNIQIYGDYNFEKYNDKSRRLIIVANK